MTCNSNNVVCRAVRLRHARMHEYRLLQHTTRHMSEDLAGSKLRYNKYELVNVMLDKGDGGDLE